MNRNSVLPLAAALASTCLVCAACGSSSKPAGSQPPAGPSSSPTSGGAQPAARGGHSINACALLTSAQASAALGSAVKAPMRTSGTQGAAATDTCVFSSTTVAGEALTIFVLNPYQSSQFATDYPASNGYQPLAGVGDQAVTLKQRTELDVLKGSTLLTITYNVLNSSGIASVAPVSQLRDLGQAAVGHL